MQEIFGAEARRAATGKSYRFAQTMLCWVLAANLLQTIVAVLSHPWLPGWLMGLRELLVDIEFASCSLLSHTLFFWLFAGLFWSHCDSQIGHTSRDAGLEAGGRIGFVYLLCAAGVLLIRLLFPV